MKNTDNLPLRLSFAEAKKLLDTDPEAAVRGWVSGVTAPKSVSSLRYLAFNREAEDLIVEIDRASLSSETQDKLIKEIESARSDFETAESNPSRAKELGQAFELGVERFFSEIQGSLEDELEQADFSEADTRDLYAMEDYSKGWSSADFINWVSHGFEATTKGYASHVRAFAPINLLPGGDPSDQFAFAFLIAKNIGLSWPERLLRATQLMLESYRLKPNKDDLAFHTHLWMMIARIQPHGRLASTARGYLEILLGFSSEEIPDNLIDSVTLTVSACRPFSGTQVRFFEWLKLETPFWRDRYFELLMNCWIGEQIEVKKFGLESGQILECWFVFVDRHTEDVAAILSQETSKGQALVNRLWSLVPLAKKAGEAVDLAKKVLLLSQSRSNEVEQIESREAELLTYDDKESSTILAGALS